MSSRGLEKGAGAWWGPGGGQEGTRPAQPWGRGHWEACRLEWCRRARELRSELGGAAGWRWRGWGLRGRQRQSRALVQEGQGAADKHHVLEFLNKQEICDAGGESSGKGHPAGCEQVGVLC